MANGLAGYFDRTDGPTGSYLDGNSMPVNELYQAYLEMRELQADGEYQRVAAGTKMLKGKGLYFSTTV
jgi:hypothetical protein